MRAREISNLLSILVERGNHTPTFIWGPPGVGKSSVVKQVAESMAIGFLDIRMTLLDPTDLRGIPIPSEGKAKWLSPSFMPDTKRDGDRGIFFLDELNAAPPLVQASGYQLVLDRQVGEYHLPDGWSVVAAGNRQGDRAVTYRMPSPLANRFIHIEFSINTEDWIVWALTHGVSEEVIGFIHFQPDLLFAFDPQRDERAFPTPRSWEYVSRLIGIPRELLSEAIAGTIGEAAAAQFLAYLNVYRDLPDIDAILNGGFTVPDRKDLKYAVITSVASRAQEGHVDHLVRYSMRYPAEYAVVLVKMLQVKQPQALIKSAAYRTEWLKKFKDVIL